MSPMSPRLLRPRAAGGFNPKTITGIAGWWDASVSTAVSLNAGEVQQWNDLSGNGRHALQSVANNQPTYALAVRNNRNAVQFNGSTDFLRGAWPLTLTAQSVFAVVSMGSGGTGGWGRPFSQTTTADATATGTMNADFSISGHYVPLLRNGTSAAFGSYNGNAHRAPVNFTYDEWGVWSSIHSGSQISNSLNGGTASTYSAATFNTTFHTFTLGAIASGVINQLMVGFIGEVVVYSRNLSNSEASAVRSYLKAKWGTP